MLIDVPFKAYLNVEPPFSAVAVCGSHPSLGEWNATKALVLARTEHVSKDGEAVWEGTCALPLNTQAEFKLVVFEELASIHGSPHDRLYGTGSCFETLIHRC